jgi:hypothetical protein
LNFFETNFVHSVSLLSGVRTTVRQSKLNPAFKRFQYLPHLPACGRGNHACAAPQVAAAPAEKPLSYALMVAAPEATLSLRAGGGGLQAGPA